VVLSQALRAMAGGQQTGAAGSDGAAHDPTGSHGGRAQRRLTTGQLVLIAAILGLLIGIGAGLLSLLL
jgi:hypothetical protein